MRIYVSAYELMSEQGRNLWEMGLIVKPKHYQNQNIEGNEDFVTKECMAEQYALLTLPDPDNLFIYTKAKDWADKEFEERLGSGINPGEAYKLRQELWDQFLVDGKFDYTYSERFSNTVGYKSLNHGYGFDTRLNTLIKLLKDDPDTRKAILPVFDASIDCNFLDGTKRIPCSMYYDFLVRPDEHGDPTLILSYHQRSSDFVQHFGNDVYLAWKLKDYVASEIGVKPGYLIHTIDSLHAYKKDWVLLKSSLK